MAYSWNSPAVRLGMGIQKAFSAELGFSYVFHQFDSRFGSGNGIIYSTWEWLPEEKINGVKVGAELSQQLGALGLDIKYQFSNEAYDIVLTPKIGLGLGFLNVFYGYNLSVHKNPFNRMGNHQFSFVFNLTRKYFKNYHSAQLH